jgi:hypothetical protein
MNAIVVVAPPERLPGLASGSQPIGVSVAGKTSPSSIKAGGTTYNIVLPVE